MEITNNSRYHSIPLVVGRRIAQIVFQATEGVLTAQEGGQESYSGEHSKYQKFTDMPTLIDNWSPYDILPKLYLDREVGNKPTDDAIDVWKSNA